MSDMKFTTEAKELAAAVWNAGNRHGPEVERKNDILKVCEEALDKAHKQGFIEGFAK